jgi:hypothetical protein
MNATCNKKSFLHVDEVSVDSGTSNSGLCVDRTEKFIVLDVRNEFKKISCLPWTFCCYDCRLSWLSRGIPCSIISIG